MTIKMDQTTLGAGADALAERAADLARAREEVAGAVEAMLAGWRGPAADRFAALWEEWRAAADEVVGSLDGGVAALRLARQDLVAADDASGVRHQRLAGRLG